MIRFIELSAIIALGLQPLCAIGTNVHPYDAISSVQLEAIAEKIPDELVQEKIGRIYLEIDFMEFEADYSEIEHGNEELISKKKDQMMELIGDYIENEGRELEETSLESEEDAFADLLDNILESHDKSQAESSQGVDSFEGESEQSTDNFPINAAVLLSIPEAENIVKEFFEKYLDSDKKETAYQMFYNEDFKNLLTKIDEWVNVQNMTSQEMDKFDDDEENLEEALWKIGDQEDEMTDLDLANSAQNTDAFESETSDSGLQGEFTTNFGTSEAATMLLENAYAEVERFFDKYLDNEEKEKGKLLLGNEEYETLLNKVVEWVDVDNMNPLEEKEFEDKYEFLAEVLERIEEGGDFTSTTAGAGMFEDVLDEKDEWSLYKIMGYLSDTKEKVENLLSEMGVNP